MSKEGEGERLGWHVRRHPLLYLVEGSPSPGLFGRLEPEMLLIGWLKSEVNKAIVHGQFSIISISANASGCSCITSCPSMKVRADLRMLMLWCFAVWHS